jgi:hypothetical protein
MRGGAISSPDLGLGSRSGMDLVVLPEMSRQPDMAISLHLALLSNSLALYLSLLIGVTVWP